MGKHEPGTPKYIANKLKTKGLQKLRWYCQMCQKQCRDENGFKCHTLSESHQRNLLLFVKHSKKIMDTFSAEFLNGFIDILKRQFGTKRVSANQVYQDYISNRDHIHMNATKWVTLTDFVKWLGRSCRCVVDETDKGWFIKYIDRDPDTIAKQERQEKKAKLDQDDEERIAEFVDKQVEQGMKQGKVVQAALPTELIRNDTDKISLKLNVKSTKLLPDRAIANMLTNSVADSLSQPKLLKSKDSQRKRSTIGQVIEAEQAAKQQKNEEGWLMPGLIVKVITNYLGEKYMNQKAVVMKICDKYVAVVRVLATDSKLKLDQAHLQTVIPQVGKKVKIVKGPNKKCTAVVEKVIFEKFRARLYVNSSEGERILQEFPYDYFSKFISD